MLDQPVGVGGREVDGGGGDAAAVRLRHEPLGEIFRVALLRRVEDGEAVAVRPLRRRDWRWRLPPAPEKGADRQRADERERREEMQRS